MIRKSTKAEKPQREHPDNGGFFLAIEPVEFKSPLHRFVFVIQKGNEKVI